MKLKRLYIIGVLLMLGCAGAKYKKTEAAVELPRYMGTWYVWAGRTSYFEQGAANSVEKYTWNAEKERIDVDFQYRKGGPKGPQKALPQKAWVVAGSGNAHWKIQPFWPLKFDYLVLAFDPDYKWTAVGVPDGKYLWIMGREPNVTDQKLAEIEVKVKETGYPVDNAPRVPQVW